jgi:hypothetical protein
MSAALIGIASVLVTLFGIYIGQRMGLWQFAIASKAHNLNVRRAVPKLGTALRIEPSQEGDPIFFAPCQYLIISIYNAGELAATQLYGYCKLSSPSNSVKQSSIPIAREFLDSTGPYELEPWLIEWTTATWNQVAFNVDIEFDYFGLSPDKPEHYKATHHFDQESRRFVII